MNFPDPRGTKLSICITTYNRAAFIGETLRSMLSQVDSSCEIVVLDAASTDETELIVSQYARESTLLRYIKQEANTGLDSDYDRVVELARGEYCWLMTDDDVLKPGAVRSVLNELHKNLSVMFVNVEAKDVSMSEIVQSRWIHFDSDREYEPEEMDRLFMELGDAVRYIGGVIIKREIWLKRERRRYYGSWFAYVGVIFQERLPGKCLVIAKPLISYRLNNTHTFSPHVLEILWMKWPSIVHSLSLSESVKSKVSLEPWKSCRELLLWRALGLYCLAEYRRLIRPRVGSVRDALMPTLVALVPGVLVNAIFVFYYSMGMRSYEGLWSSTVILQRLRKSRYSFQNLRFIRQR